MDFKELIRQFLDSQILVYLLYAYLFGLVFYIIYSILNYFRDYSKMKKRLSDVYARMNEQEQERARIERQQRDIIGKGAKRDLLARVDEQLMLSGIKDTISWITTEIWILFEIIIVSLTAVVIVLAQGNILFAFLGAFVAFIILKLIIRLMINSRSKKTDQQMLQLMNIVDNFSKTSNDLIDVLEKSARYLEAPLGPQILDAVIESRNSGDYITALSELENKVPNEHFRILIKNLEITSRYDNNYSLVVEDCRDSFHEHIKASKEKTSIKFNGLLEVILMLATGFVCVYIIGAVTDEGNVIGLLLTGGAGGLFILIYLIASIAAALYIAVFQILMLKD